MKETVYSLLRIEFFPNIPSFVLYFVITSFLDNSIENNY